MNMKIANRYFMPGICMAVWMAAMALESAQASELVAQKYPDVVKVAVRAHGADSFDFDVTLSSPYDTPDRYADAFKVMNKDGSVYGERKLWHDHADEQPFTRDLYNVAIPRGVREVVIQSRDKLYGYGGKTVEVKLPGR
jgi:hypothetical protein